MEFESLFHALCYQNQTDKLHPKKRNFVVCDKDQVGAQSEFQEIFRISFATKEKRQHRLQKNFAKGGRKLALYATWVAFAMPCHPMAIGLCTIFKEK